MSKFTFNLYKKSYIYRIIVDGFHVTSSWFARIRIPKISLSVIPVVGVLFYPITKIKKITTGVSSNLIKLRSKFVGNVSIKKIGIIALTAWENLFYIDNLKIKRIRTIVSGYKIILKYKINELLKINRVKIIAVSVVGSLLKLYYYDAVYDTPPSLLDKMDNKYLSELNLGS